MDDIEAHESKLYSELAPLYDKVFGKIFYSRLERVIEDLDIPAGAKILEVGAGTGTSFPAYPTHCEITGVDLAPDMPVVAGVGGNGATQTATVIIRAIALGELEFASAWKAIVKQVSVNICIGLAAGALIATAAFLWKGNPFLGLVLAAAMICNLGLMAGFAGAVIPLLLKALKFDPALGSGIIVTGLTDAFGFLSFLGLASYFRRYLV